MGFEISPFLSLDLTLPVRLKILVRNDCRYALHADGHNVVLAR